MGKARLTVKTKANVTKRHNKGKKNIGTGDAGVHSAKLRIVLEQQKS